MKLEKAKGINIDKAINLNIMVLGIFDDRLEEIEKAAILLGNEALKREKENRKSLPSYKIQKLPGEMP